MTFAPLRCAWGVSESPSLLVCVCVCVCALLLSLCCSAASHGCAPGHWPADDEEQARVNFRCSSQNLADKNRERGWELEQSEGVGCDKNNSKKKKSREKFTFVSHFETHAVRCLQQERPIQQASIQFERPLALRKIALSMDLSIHEMPSTSKIPNKSAIELKGKVDELKKNLERCVRAAGSLLGLRSAFAAVVSRNRKSASVGMRVLYRTEGDLNSLTQYEKDLSQYLETLYGLLLQGSQDVTRKSQLVAGMNATGYQGGMNDCFNHINSRAIDYRQLMVPTGHFFQAPV